ncbi:NmrA family NAD(P)-binding protein [Streptomyces sp. NPDC097619]|uniref:NmrA family NAD(P)-binding protein n=1 Tax=Streptomyces sp. NPDC097619 TaxID=3157228 RepID=UPI0033182D10
MITVMGASGATGGALVRHLRELGVPCRALTRAPHALTAALATGPHPGGAPAPSAPSARVDVIGADAAEPDTLRAALAGSEQLFLAMANGPRQVALERAALDAAAATGVRHVVKLSAPAAEPDSPVAVSRDHHAIERHLAASGMTGTVLRPYAFMHKLLLAAPAIARGALVSSLGDAPCAYVDVRDVAEAAAEVLLRPYLAGAAYPLTGPRAYTPHQLAGLLSEVVGRPVRPVHLSPEEFHRHLRDTAGMPDRLARHVTEIQHLARTRPESPDGTLERLLGRPARTLPAFLDEHRTHFAPPPLAPPTTP